MKKNSLLAVIFAAVLSLGSYEAGAQGMAVNTTGAPANGSAILDVSSTTQGMLVPRMLSSQRAGISSPVAGLLVYQTDAPAGFYYYTGSGWLSLNSTSTTAGGDLAGTYPNPTISSTAGADVVSAINSSTSTINTARLGSSSGIGSTFLNGTGAFAAPFSLTTTGSSGAATFSGGTLNIPQYAGTGWGASGTNIYNNNPGYVGIGTTAPTALLDVADSAVLFSAAGDVPATQTAPPMSGTGRRMMWYPQKAAFRAGYALGNAWDKDSIGLYSAAFGHACHASGIYSFAAGDSAFANGNSAVCFGGGDAVWGWPFAWGDYTFAAGYANIVRGKYSASIGGYNVAEGIGAYSFGLDAVAAADSSMAFGYNSYALHAGACLMTDDNGNWSGGVLYSSAKNQMTMRYTGGYRLYTNWTGSSSTVGVSLPAGGNSWSTISDRRKKTNFAPVNGEEILKKIDGFELTSWNYKDQEAADFRHYGPMAQDFFAAFGHDQYGRIGDDTTIGQADLEGVSFIAIQALEKRTNQQAAEIAQLKALLAGLSETNKGLKAELTEKDKAIKTRLEVIETEIEKGKMTNK